MKRILRLLILLNISHLYGFEVNTHQALTRCALTQYCGTDGVKNLKQFINHSQISTAITEYQDQKFEGYGNISYEDYANGGMGFQNWNISITPNYLGMIEAGVVLEDAVYPNAHNDGDGRFNNHFYAAQFDAKSACGTNLLINPLGLADPDDMQTPRALCYGYGVRTDNITWALKAGVNLGENRTNDYNLPHAFEYFKKSF